MSLEIDLDLTGTDEQEVEASGTLDPGWYAVMVDDVHEDQKNPGTVLFRFKVTEGPRAGGKIGDRLFHPDNAPDLDKAKTAKTRMALFAKRLGLIGSDAFGTQVSLNWSDAVGREAVIKVEKRSYTDKDGVRQETVSVAFAGLFHPSDDRVPAELRRPAIGEVPAAATPTKKPAARAAAKPAARPTPPRPTTNYDDL